MAVRYFEDLEVGQSAERTVTVQDQDIVAFARVSGDHNPLHLDEEYARTTVFKSRIAHGMLAGAYISATLADQLPGPGAVYVAQTLNFKRAIRIGDAVRVQVTVKSLDPKEGLAVLSTGCFVGRKSMVDGEATVMVPRRPVEAAA